MTKFNTNFMDTTPFSDTGAKLKLAASTELTWTVPGENTQRYRALFAFNANVDVWIAINNTVELPTAGTVTDTYNQELRPTARYVKGGDVLHFISTGTPDVGVSLLELPN